MLRVSSCTHLVKQHRLRLNPLDGGRELVRQQLDQQGGGDLRGSVIVPRRQDLLQILTGRASYDFLHVFVVQRERFCDDVGNVQLPQRL